MNIPTSDNHQDDVTVGIAANPGFLEVFIFEHGVHWRESNTHEGIRTLLKNLSHYGLSRILIEAKGACVRHLIKACTYRELPVIIVDPAEVIEQLKESEPFANIGQLDARLIAYMGATMKPQPHPCFTQKLVHIEELLELKQQLNLIKTAAIARAQDMPNAVISLHTDFIELLDREILAIDQRLAGEIAERGEWQYIYEILSAAID